MKHVSTGRRGPAKHHRIRGRGQPSSYTRPRVTYWPPPATALLRIPPSPVGLIDTIKVVLRHRCHRQDIQALCARGDFEVTQRDGSRVMKGGVTIRTFGRRVDLYRKSDGCRIRISDDGIVVEVSLPRVLGLLNDEQDKMTEDDVRRALRMVTLDLFPRTTWRAKVPKPGSQDPRRFWHITRLDIAVNFNGETVEFVETYRHGRRQRSSAQPEVYEETGMAFYGKDFDLLIYDPAARHPRGKLRQSLEGKAFAPGPNRVRAEFRFKTLRAIKRMLSSFALDYRGLPFMASRSDGTEAVYCFGLDHHRLHQILATELNGLGPGGTTRGVDATSMNLLRRFGFLYLEEHPEKWAEMKAVLKGRTLRRLRREFAALQIEERKIDLVQAAWSCARVDPSTPADRHSPF